MGDEFAIQNDRTEKRFSARPIGFLAGRPTGHQGLFPPSWPHARHAEPRGPEGRASMMLARRAVKSDELRADRIAREPVAPVVLERRSVSRLDLDRYPPAATPTNRRRRAGEENHHGAPRHCSRVPEQSTHRRIRINHRIELTTAKDQTATCGPLSPQGPLRCPVVGFRVDLDRHPREQEIQQEIQQEQLERQQANAMVFRLSGSDWPEGELAQPPTAGLLSDTCCVPPMLPDEIQGAAIAVAESLSLVQPAQRQQEPKVNRTQHRTSHEIVRTRLQQDRLAIAQQGRQVGLECDRGRAPDPLEKSEK